MNGVAQFKVFAAFCICILGLIGGSAPLWLNVRGDSYVNSALNMFAAGIFLASSMLHLLPSAQASTSLAALGCWDVNGTERCLDLAYFIYGCGFLIVLMVEVGANALQEKIKSKKVQKSALIPLKSFSDTTQSLSIKSSAKTQSTSYDTFDADSCSSRELKELANEDGNIPNDTLETEHAHDTNPELAPNPVLAIVVFIALSFHSIMEGMGIGASNQATWDILIAIFAHKSLASFAVVLELSHHNNSREKLIRYILLFSIMTPCGIFLGWGLVEEVKNDGGQAGATRAICAAMAAGTFLFVAVMELIPQELKSQKHIFKKVSALILGYTAMGLLSVYT